MNPPMLKPTQAGQLSSNRENNDAMDKAIMIGAGTAATATNAATTTEEEGKKYANEATVAAKAEEEARRHLIEYNRERSAAATVIPVPMVNLVEPEPRPLSTVPGTPVPVASAAVKPSGGAIPSGGEPRIKL